MSKHEMTVGQFLKYAKQFNNLPHASEDKAKEACEKLLAIMERFGFTFYKGFSAYCGQFTNEKDTSWYYRLQTSEHGYIEVQIGTVKRTATRGYGQQKEKYVRGYDGLFRVYDNTKPDLNPATGKPWKVGDWDYSDEMRPRQLTRMGWYTGD